MNNPRGARSPDRAPRSGLRVVPEQRRRPAPRPPTGRVCDDPTVRVRGIIYAWLCYEVDPRTGRLLPPDPVTGQRRTRLDYVGQTIRDLDVRAGEHLDDKPWADIVVSNLPIIIEQGMWTKAERDAKEVAAIHRLRPRYNHDDNLHNPERIPIYDPATRRYVQLEQRHVRDGVAGRALWLPLDQRSLAAQVAAEKAVVGFGLDGREPRYPLTVAGELLVAAGGAMMRLPRRVQLAVLAALSWVGAVWASSAWLTAAGWPDTVALTGALVWWTAVTVGALRNKRVRRWSRRKRR